MKRLFAVMLALMMLAVSGASLAEGTMPSGIQMELTLTLDQETLTSMLEGDEESIAMFNAVSDVLSAFALRMTAGETGAHVALEMQDTELATLDAAVDGENVTVVSSLFPSYAVTASLEDVEESMTMTLGDQTLGAEELEAMLSQAAVLSEQIEAALTPYVEDVAQISAAMAENAEQTEDGAVIVTMTTHDVANLLNAWASRLSTDEVLLPMLQALLEQTGEEIAVADLLEQITGAAAEMLSVDAEYMGMMQYEEDDQGNVMLTCDLMNMLYVGMDMAQDGSEIEFVIVTCGEGTGDYQGVLDAIMNGENYDDCYIDIYVSAMEMDDIQSAGVEVYAIVEGTEYSGSLSTVVCTTEGSEFVDVALTYDLFGAEIMITEAEAPAAPVLDGKTVIDAATAGDAEAELLLQEIQSVGLTGILAQAEALMPEQMAIVENLIQMMLQE